MKHTQRRLGRGSTPVILVGAVLAIGLLGAKVASSQAPERDLPEAVTDQQEARFPQPVKVGDLMKWPVIQAGGHYHHLGHVVGVFQPKDGDPVLVMRTSGFFGVGARLVAPPLDAVSLVGPMVKIADLDPKEFAALPTFQPAQGAFLGADDVVRIGVDRKY
jgi:hypothetical protein